MKIVIAMDSFKGSMSSMEAGNAAAEGIKRVCADALVTVKPLADGGEGTAKALTIGLGGRMRHIIVTGPLGSSVACAYGIVDNTKTAVIEMAGAAGLTLISEQERNPFNTTTYGVGEVIRDAIGQGCRHFIIGIGGSATNDGGIGMLQALGYDMLNAAGKQVAWGAKGLAEIVQIGTAHVLPELAACRFQIACDVENPLCGDNGCSAVFGPQKGATPEMVRQMDAWLAAYAALAGVQFPAANPKQAGTGAAGGLGFAFLTFTNAVLESGIQIVMKETNLEQYVKDADLVITGEGRLDGQTVMGKAPIGVAALAKKYGRPVIAFSGCAARDASVCNKAGIDAFFPILRQAVTAEEAMQPENAKANMADTAEQVFRLLQLKRSIGYGEVV